MPLGKRSKKQENPKPITLLEKKIVHPFPLRWGIAAIGLFAIFAIITQLQFSRISNEKIREARLDTYYSDVRVYEASKKANEDCIKTIQIRQTSRELFIGISDLFKRVAEIPVIVTPNNIESLNQRDDLIYKIKILITEPLELGFSEQKASDCPQILLKKPIAPKDLNYG